MNNYLKPKKRCAPVCQEHLFQLTPKRSDCWMKASVSIDYCPIINEFTGQYENIVPILNNDRQACLPAFILEVDKTQYQFNLERYQYEHQAKIEEVHVKKSKMYVPKPGKKHRYCGVCKTNYDEYLNKKQHVQSHRHIMNFHAYRSVNLVKALVMGYLQNYEFSEQQKNTQSNILCCDSNTRIPMNRENFATYFDSERIGVRFQKPQEFIPPLEVKLPKARRGRPPKQSSQSVQKKIKKEEKQPQPRMLPPPHFNYMDYYYMPQCYMQHPQFQYPPFQPINMVQYYNQQQVEQQGRENPERQQLWQRLIQLANQQSGQPQQNDIVQLVHSIIESYENNPRQYQGGERQQQQQQQQQQQNQQQP